ncbi:hypothetical protein A2209_01710 [Candidatus Roizmanbacteria bacterium RIFOXYA1_FULL_41_12]|uniref:Glycosyltransferase RgtA/B/C/D-like domain-containing protein n=1 Tax=Candidatus Roizmanbacteria bacterium RIFOXYA1_FULL_41_12 TaxID=1802082 RepID=A0A1F7KF09_9BACT|nr:MAG: hypothetical protein A2209_01710 [Candidatus Roizmanbacteria bacterium RIFOXYA1_FULL_41_12]OGK71953.1 MAG: hypothetical protein A2403_03290 [Candidatus Roizmanbacteria bacterium RIFOXYC1_FULL_41_16]OGK75360.1 MAG: hypothetical protein A2575_01985 [Candidatus Roizmanbacteria bacterium RIFOXYD1_FULL_41_24]
MLYFNRKRLIPLMILLFSSLVVFWQFPLIPQKMAFDELEFAKLALDLEGKWQIFSKQATGHATPYFYLLLLSFKTFGLNIGALRLPAALFGVANCVLVYYLFRRFFSDWLAALGALIFGFSHWVFNFSRFGFEATYLLFWELFGVINLLSYLKNKKILNLGLLLVATLASFYSYLPGRLFFLLPTAIMIINKVKTKYWLTYLILFSVFALPLVLVTGGTENRVQELLYLNQDLPLITKLGYFWENIVKNILMLNFYGDLNGRHNYPGKPGLNPAMGVLFWIGLALSLKNRTKYWFFYLWIILSIVPSLLTLPTDNPHFLRTYTVTVGLVFLITLALKTLFKRFPKAVILILLLVIASGIYEVRTYFKYQKPVFNKAFEKTPLDLNKLKIGNNRQEL